MARKIKNSYMLVKCATGIPGLDDITQGGLPRGRPTLVCGGPGCGKTLMAMEFIVRGIREFGEPGVFMTFEEKQEELITNCHSLGFNLAQLIRDKKLAIDEVDIHRSEIHETGEYDLEGLFVRLGTLIDRVGAKRVVLDTLEVLFAALPNEAIIRAELRRLFGWLKDRRVTALVTAEQGTGTLTRHGLEEYVSDCVILLDHRVNNQIATRHLRIVKYRGSKHATSEYPTLIDEHGISVLPISSLGLTYPVSREFIPTGVDRLDTMLNGKGYYKASSILISGTAGTGKTSLAAAFVDRNCRSGHKSLYFSFEESPEQVMRNMSSIGLDLAAWVRSGLLRFEAVRPTLFGLESHLVRLHRLVEDYRPDALVVDPVTNLAAVGQNFEITAMLTRLIDYLKSSGITSVFTSLTAGGSPEEQSTVSISSLMDTWLLLRIVESANERNRLLYILKSRGMAHSNQMREFVLSSRGIQLLNVYAGPGTVLTGSARLAQEARDREEELTRKQAATQRLRDLEHEQAALQTEMLASQEKLKNITQELTNAGGREKERLSIFQEDRRRMATLRHAD